MMKSMISKDDCFMTMVFLLAMLSKDESTHQGAVIVDKRNRIVSVGYNSFPMGINDCVPERQERPEKYFWFEHSERNAIYNAKRDLEGCRMYTNGIPCMDCARGIVQAGIKEVVVDKVWNDNNYNQWKEHAERTSILFQEADVKLRIWDGKLVDVFRYGNGKILTDTEKES